MQVRIDIYGWAFHGMAKGLKKYIDPKIKICLDKELKDEPTLHLGGMYCPYPDNTNMLLCSHGLKNLKAKRFFSYSRVVEEYYPEYQCTPIKPSIDPDYFRYPRTYGKKFRVGFAGNKHRDVKGYPLFTEVKSLLSNNSSISFTECSLDISSGEPKPQIPYSEMYKFYQTVDIILCTSTYDSGPSCCYEAALMGIPTVVCSPNVGWYDSMSEMHTFKTSYDAKSIVDLLLLLERNRDLAKTVGLSVKEYAFENFTFLANKDEWLEALCV